MYTYNNLSNATINYLNYFYEILDEMIYGMTSAKPTESISHTFIVQMIPHHMAAIRMSRNLLLYTTCIPLQNIAENIIISQTKSIHDMKQADLTCSKIYNSNQELCSYLKCYEKITNEMFSQMANAEPFVKKLITWELLYYADPGLHPAGKEFVAGVFGKHLSSDGRI